MALSSVEPMTSFNGLPDTDFSLMTSIGTPPLVVLVTDRGDLYLSTALFSPCTPIADLKDCC